MSSLSLISSVEISSERGEDDWVVKLTADALHDDGSRGAHDLSCGVTTVLQRVQEGLIGLSAISHMPDQLVLVRWLYFPIFFVCFWLFFALQVNRSFWALRE